MSDMLMLQPSIRGEITQAVDSTILVLDETLRGMNEQEKAYYLRDQMNALGVFNAKITQAMLYLTWRVLSDALWAVPISHDEDGNPIHYESFRDWVDHEIGPTFKKRGKNGKEFSYMADIVRVCERTLMYALRHPVRDESGVPITPTYLIEKVGFSKLKITSSDFLDTTRTPDRDKELVDITSKPAKKIRELYSTPRIPVIKYGLNINPDGTSDVIMVGLSTNQVGVFRTALGRLIKEYAMHIGAADREALVTQLLPIDARKQDEPVKAVIDTDTDTDL